MGSFGAALERSVQERVVGRRGGISSLSRTQQRQRLLGSGHGERRSRLAAARPGAGTECRRAGPVVRRRGRPNGETGAR
jgi:hypothetical protein